MHSPLEHYIVDASRQLQSGVALIAKCGGISFTTANGDEVVNIITVDRWSEFAYADAGLPGA